MCVSKVLRLSHNEMCLFPVTDVGGDGDWSIQTCREETHGFQSGHQDGQVSPVSEGGERKIGREERDSDVVRGEGERWERGWFC